MNDKFFLDTNVLVYSFDPVHTDKCDKARQMIEEGLESGLGRISFQVIQEFLSLTTRRFPSPMSAEAAVKYLHGVLTPLCYVHSNAEIYAEALDIHQRWQYSFYDSLIIAAALRADCSILYSEDLQHEQIIRGLTIRNPFRK